ncbi:ATP-binding protein [Candidatus Hadarchaeum sp.]|uniref:ATP-binding protein n=1 Tax=Candidatus Hadarchaeum sp. TaxID=2883567 RepID=UPI003D1008FF
MEDWNLWARDQNTGIMRDDYLSKMSSLWNALGTCTAVVGVRRAGKTFISKQFLKKLIGEGWRREQTLYVNFEDPVLRPMLSVGLLQDIYETYRHFLNQTETAVIILDEVQNVQGWESWVRSMLDKQEKVRMIITGSSSQLLRGELASALTGRILTLEVFPLDFGEFLRFKGFEGDPLFRRREVLSLLREYLEFGGFPQAVLAEDRDVKRAVLKELFEGILTRDVAERHGVREVGDLKRLAVLTVGNFSSYISVKRLLHLFTSITRRKVSPSTINQFLNHFREAFLCFYVPIFSYKVKDQLLYPRKVYPVDVGLVNAVVPRPLENLGGLAENVVAISLLKKFGEESIFYWKDRISEVDFVVKEGMRVRQLIQVCWDPTDEETKKREVKGLLRAMEEFRLREGLVLTEYFEEGEEVEGKRIIYRPLWKWLLEVGS